MKSNIVFTVIFSILFVLGAVFFLISRGMAMYLMALPAIPVGIYLLNKPKFLYGAIICLPFSRITVPGLPGSLYLFHLFLLFAFGIGLLNNAIQKNNRRGFSLAQKSAMLFMLNIFVIMYFRGAGLRIFGGDQWGGMRYVELLTPFLLLFLNPPFVYTVKEWKRIMMLFMMFSSLPLLSEIVFLASGGRLYHVYYVIKFNMSTINSYLAEMRGAEVVRFQTATRIATLFVITSLVLYRTNVRKIYFVITYILGVVLVGISGHRSISLDLIVLSWIVFLISFWKQRWVYIIISAFCGVLLVGFVYIFASELPANFQRAVSFLPGISISEAARQDAMITIDWRLNIWNEGMNEIKNNPGFLILGKGLTYSAAEYLALQLFDFHYWWAILTSNYHQGALSLLIVTGIPGLITISCFFVFTMRESIRNLIKMPHVPFLTDLYLLITIYFGLLVFKYFVIYGDMTSSFTPLCYSAFLMKHIFVTQKNEVGFGELNKN